MWLKDDRIVFHPSYKLKNMQNQPSFILPGLERDRCKNKVPLWFDRSEKKLDEKTSIIQFASPSMQLL